MLLICPVRPGESNEELRYALRSWETNLILDGGLELMVVGHQPSWLAADHFVSGNRHSSAPHNVFDNVLLGALEAVRLNHDEVVYMNDDFFCLDPVGKILPVKRNETLAEHCARFSPGASTWWPASLRLTASWLREEGFSHPDSYEAHRPLIASPEGMKEALSRWLSVSSQYPEGVFPQWRTAYGVLNKVTAYPIKDAKLNARTHGIGTPWVSTADETWRRYATGLTKRFQKPSRWER